MSQQPEIEWDTRRQNWFAYWLNCVLELRCIAPACRLAPEPRTGLPGVVVEWETFGRKVEFYAAYTGEASIICRDGGPSNFLPLAGVRDAVEPLRQSLAWMERREKPCPPAA